MGSRKKSLQSTYDKEYDDDFVDIEDCLPPRAFVGTGNVTVARRPSLNRHSVSSPRFASRSSLSTHNQTIPRQTGSGMASMVRGTNRPASRWSSVLSDEEWSRRQHNQTSLESSGDGSHWARGRNDQSRQHRPRFTPDATEIMSRDMKGWGVDCEVFRTEHLDYVRVAMEGLEDLVPDCLETLPLEAKDAYKQVFIQEVRAMVANRETLTNCIDTLAEEFPDLKGLPPFVFDRDTRNYVLRQEFRVKNLENDPRLNPFTRFLFVKRPPKVQLRAQMVDDNEPIGQAARAIVAHHACHYAKCLTCHANSLCWNCYKPDDGVLFRYWKKLVCESCGSVYEVKPAKDEDSILWKIRNRRRFNGNFFGAYHAVQKELPRRAQHYVVFVAMKTIIQETNEFWPVHVAKVSDVQPCLKPNSFEVNDARGTNIRVWSRFSCADCEPWFHAPFVDVDFRALASDVIDSL